MRILPTIWFTNVIIKYVFNKSVHLVLCCQVVERTFWEKLQHPDSGVESHWSSMKMTLISSGFEKGHSLERKQCCCSPFGLKTLQSIFLIIVSSSELMHRKFPVQTCFPSYFIWSTHGPSPALPLPPGLSSSFVSTSTFPLEATAWNPTICFCQRTHIPGLWRQGGPHSDVHQLPGPTAWTRSETGCDRASQHSSQLRAGQTELSGCSGLFFWKVVDEPHRN